MDTLVNDSGHPQVNEVIKLMRVKSRMSSVRIGLYIG